MSEATENGVVSLLGRPAPQLADKQVVTLPIRAQLDELLRSGGWSQNELTKEQLRVLVSMLTERRQLLETVRSLKSTLDQLQAVADHDTLLPIYNRRAFERELSKQLSFCFRYETNACLIYMDLDHFKLINDSFGHSTGDLALKKFGEIVIGHTRESDLIGRLGGDEFAVLLVNADMESGKTKAEMFREDAEKMRFGPADRELGFGLSYGVVEWQRGESPEHMLARADEVMYLNKIRRQKTESDAS